MFCGETKLTEEEAIKLKKYEQNSIYFLKHEDELRKDYSDMHVAVYDMRVVDSDTNLKFLLSRLDGKYGEEETKKIAVQYTSKKRIDLKLPRVAA